MYTLQLVVREELPVSFVIKWMSTQYKMSGSTSVMSNVGGASQVRWIILIRLALVRLLTAAGLPGDKKSVVSFINHSNSVDVNSTQ